MQVSRIGILVVLGDWIWEGGLFVCLLVVFLWGGWREQKGRMEGRGWGERRRGGEEWDRGMRWDGME